MSWHPGLDRIEESAGQQCARSAGWLERSRADNREPSTLMGAIGSWTDCWCGERVGHDWPGKRDGDPHPRPLRHVVMAGARALETAS